MKKNLHSALYAIFLSLTASAALADPAPASSADLPKATLLALDDSDMDRIVAAGQVTATQAQASALKGRAISFSITNLVASQLISVSTASSLAIAIGVHPQTLATASAINF